MPAPTFYLELSDTTAGTHKFYAVERDGTNVTLRFGRIGAAGRTEMQTFATDAEAQAFADAKVREKTAKGYAPAVPGERAPLPPPTPPAPGTEAWFWRLIDNARRGTDGDCEAQCAALQERLARLPVPDILAFGRFFDGMKHAAFYNNLWEAAFIINRSELSDDGFEDFFGWLVSQGERVYLAARSDPDSLTDIISKEGGAECEGMLYVAQFAYEAKTGRADFYDLLPPHKPPAQTGNLSAWDDGKGGMDALKAQSLYPRLWAKFGW